jgi:hypothetical protein
MRTLALILAVAAAGCTGGTSTDDGSNPGGDMAGAGTVDMSGDMAVVKTMQFNWTLITAKLQNGNNNGFPINCNDPMLNATSVLLKATDGMMTTMMTVPCPPNMNEGSVDPFPLPNMTNGPFVFTGAVVGAAMSNSEKISASLSDGSVHVLIYAFGCDAPECS